MKNWFILFVSFCLLCKVGNAQQTNEIFQNIEPSLENGFHAQFQINSPKEQNPQMIESNTTKVVTLPVSTTISNHKTKKNNSIAALSFNFRKRIKNVFPFRKKIYKTYLCANF